MAGRKVTCGDIYSDMCRYVTFAINTGVVPLFSP